MVNTSTSAQTLSFRSQLSPFRHPTRVFPFDEELATILACQLVVIEMEHVSPLLASMTEKSSAFVSGGIAACAILLAAGISSSPSSTRRGIAEAEY